MIDLLAALLLTLSHSLGGSVGAAILAVSIGFRLAWLPFAVRFAVQARERAAAMLVLKPEVEALEKRHADPMERFTAVQALYTEHGLNPTFAQFAPILAQAPFIWGMFATVQRLGATSAFLWIPNLARPDLALAALATSLMGTAAWLGADTPQARLFAGVSTVIFFVIASRMAASVGLLMATSAGVQTLQNVWVRRQVAGH